MAGGVAGALYVPQVGIINPSEFSARQLDRGGALWVASAAAAR